MRVKKHHHLAFIVRVVLQAGTAGDYRHVRENEHAKNTCENRAHAGSNKGRPNGHSGNDDHIERHDVHEIVGKLLM